MILDGNHPTDNFLPCRHTTLQQNLFADCGWHDYRPTEPECGSAILLASPEPQHIADNTFTHCAHEVRHHSGSGRDFVLWGPQS